MGVCYTHLWNKWHISDIKLVGDAIYKDSVKTGVRDNDFLPAFGGRGPFISSIYIFQQHFLYERNAVKEFTAKRLCLFPQKVVVCILVAPAGQRRLQLNVNPVVYGKQMCIRDSI